MGINILKTQVEATNGDPVYVEVDGDSVKMWSERTNSVLELSFSEFDEIAALTGFIREVISDRDRPKGRIVDLDDDLEDLEDA